MKPQHPRPLTRHGPTMEDTNSAPEPGSRPSDPEPTAATAAGAVEFLTLGLTVAVALVGCPPWATWSTGGWAPSPWFTLVGVVSVSSPPC